ncbi:unnamed protein product [Heterosigma akashiwo]
MSKLVVKHFPMFLLLCNLKQQQVRPFSAVQQAHSNFRHNKQKQIQPWVATNVRSSAFKKQIVCEESAASTLIDSVRTHHSSLSISATRGQSDEAAGPIIDRIIERRPVRIIVKNDDDRVISIAHQGSSAAYPGNTMAAFKAAVKEGQT